jgi:diacylglycerol kinase (ATP)
MIITYLTARLRSIGHAVQGIFILIRTQPNARLHAAATGAVLIAGYFLGLKPWEWVAVLLCIGLVWVAEALNTALEFLADEVTQEHRHRIGCAKDVAAAGVLIAALISILVAGVILLHHL